MVLLHDLVHLSEERFKLPLPPALSLAFPLPVVVVSPGSWRRGLDFLTFLWACGEVCGLLGLLMWQGDWDFLPSGGLGEVGDGLGVLTMAITCS